MKLFKGSLALCCDEEFKFNDFYKIINNFKNDMGLKLKNIMGKDSEITYIFGFDEPKKDNIFIIFDSRYEVLSIDIEACCSLEDFNLCYKKLQEQIKLIYKNN